MSIRVLCVAITGASLIAATPAVRAEQWPSRAIKVVSPFTVGNAADTMARIVLDWARLTNSWRRG
jgi:tripartite-type tricarboxylate transporter receptor subunit TctC